MGSTKEDRFLRKMTTNESSGRWDASGSFVAAVNEQRQLALNWARSLNMEALIHHIEIMALDHNGLTLYERKALLEVVVDVLQGEFFDD